MNPEENSPSFIQAVAGLFGTLKSVIQNTATLFVLELQLAKKSLAWILMLSILGIIFLISAWFCLLATLVAVLVWLKFSWLIAFLIVTAINLLIFISLIFVILRLCHYLTFPATRQQFNFTHSEDKSNHASPTEENTST